jgi:hypothetical protein
MSRRQFVPKAIPPPREGRVHGVTSCHRKRFTKPVPKVRFSSSRFAQLPQWFTAGEKRDVRRFTSNRPRVWWSVRSGEPSPCLASTAEGKLCYHRRFALQPAPRASSLSRNAKPFVSATARGQSSPIVVVFADRVNDALAAR